MVMAVTASRLPAPAVTAPSAAWEGTASLLPTTLRRARPLFDREIVVRATPLYQGVALTRALTTGEVGWSLLWHVLYLAVMGVLGLTVASRRLEHLLLK
jgi:hypothetical protein